MFKETQIWDCPFCGKNTIEVLYTPKTARPEKTSWGGSRAWMKVSKENIIVQSWCSNCGKTAIEIKRAMKEGVPPDKEKLKKRYEELQKLKEEMKRKRESKDL